MKQPLARFEIAVLIAACTLTLHAQPPASQGGGRGRGTAITSPRDAYPDRPRADAETIGRGRALYSANCAFCHGPDTRGGDSGPSLLRSGLVLDDQHGELIGPVVQNGRVDRGMPKFAFSTDQIADVAAFIHSFKVGGYDESRQKPPSILVGDAKAGDAFFAAHCSSCHSPTGDLRGLAGKIPDEKQLQQTWLLPGSGGGRGSRPPVSPPRTTVIVTRQSGEKIQGQLERIDDFTVSLVTADGTHRSFRIEGDTPKVEVQDPLQAHRDLLRVYADKDIHDVTAYLMTLK